MRTIVHLSDIHFGATDPTVVDGIVAVALGILIAYQWPSSSTWAIGTLVGANLLVSGFTRLFISAAAKSELSPAH